MVSCSGLLPCRMPRRRKVTGKSQHSRGRLEGPFHSLAADTLSDTLSAECPSFFGVVGGCPRTPKIEKLSSNRRQTGTFGNLQKQATALSTPPARTGIRPIFRRRRAVANLVLMARAVFGLWSAILASIPPILAHIGPSSASTSAFPELRALSPRFRPTLRFDLRLPASRPGF